MNRKHPIDELFAQTLRDAEAQPPPAVWEGIVRDRQKKGAQRLRRWWGYAAILLLLVGAAGYWAMRPTESDQLIENQSVGSAPARDAQAPAEAIEEQSTGTDPKEPISSPAPAEQQQLLTEASDPRTTPESSSQAQAHPDEVSPKPEAPKANNKGQKGAVTVGASAAADGMKTEKARGNQTKDTDPAKEGTASFQAKDPGSAALDNGSTLGPEPAISASAPLEDPAQPSAPEHPSRSTPDVHLPELSTLPSPMLQTSEVLAPGPLLKGDTVPTYLLSRGRLWFALQADMAVLNGEWRGSGPEVADLNSSEAWRNGQGLGLAAGYEWMNGWSVGLGIGVNRQRSRFLRQEVEGGSTETVVDTTWTSYAAGPMTNTTWDIIETTIVEPGVEHEYNATNTYTQLRIAPEVSYQFTDLKRFSVHGRIAPMLLMDIGRKGNTLVSAPTGNNTDTSTITLTVLPLTDPSLDDRFPMRFAVSAGVELRYQLLDRWSLAASPTCTWWLPRAEGPTPSLTMTEMGGMVRLRYELRQKERFVK